ncbi:MAG: AMP-binding protein, partial [Brevibacterium sp.]|nr:AMP-binding protein [Brevibacterium sp.]
MTTNASNTPAPDLHFSSTVADIVRRSAGRFGEDIAVEFGDRTWTYSSLDTAVTAVARELVSLGAQKGDRIAAYGKNSDLYLLLYLGCARAGLIHVPVNYQLKNDELDYILDNSGAKVVFADGDLLGAVTATPTGSGVQVKNFTVLLDPATAADVTPAAAGEFAVVDTD